MIRAIIEKSPFNFSSSVYIGEQEGNFFQSVALPLTMETREPGKIFPPTFELTDEEAQNFIDELWRAGFRPREGTGSAGSLAATEKHLQDMREIVFKYVMPTIQFVK